MSTNSSLEKLQLLSMMSRFSAVAIGLLQSFFLFRILTLHEFGVIQIAVAVGGALGIYQHLGLASGSTREIAAAKDDDEVFKLFSTSVFIRYMVTLPLAVGLFVLAKEIALNRYDNPELVLPLQIYAVTLIVQGFQSMLNSVIAGTRRFKTLFTYQIAIAVVSLFFYLPLTYLYDIKGYFYAFFLHNLVGTLTLSYLALVPLKTNYRLPNFAEFKFFFKELFTISFSLYLVKVVYTFWEKSGPLILGLDISPELVAVFAAALVFAKKIMHVSDAITDVNLPYFSDKFVKEPEEFRKSFLLNFNRIFVFILLAGVTATFWAKEIIWIFASEKYIEAFPLIFPLVFMFILYAFLNIIKSSILVPAKMVLHLSVTYLVLLGVSLASYYLSQNLGLMPPVGAMALSLLIGSLSSLLYASIVIWIKLGIQVFDHSHVLLMVQAIIIGISNNVFEDRYIMRGLVFIGFMVLFAIGIYSSKFVTKEDVRRIFVKLKLA